MGYGVNCGETCAVCGNQLSGFFAWNLVPVLVPDADMPIYTSGVGESESELR